MSCITSPSELPSYICNVSLRPANWEAWGSAATACLTPMVIGTPKCWSFLNCSGAGVPGAGAQVNGATDGGRALQLPAGLRLR